MIIYNEIFKVINSKVKFFFFSISTSVTYAQGFGLLYPLFAKGFGLLDFYLCPGVRTT